MRTMLFVSFLIGMMASAVSAVDCTWTGAGQDDLWSNPQNWENDIAPTGNGDNAIFPADSAPSVVRVGASAEIRTVYFRNPLGTTLTVDSGANLHFSNSGALTIRAEEDALIDGLGTLTFSTGGGENWADNQAYPGKTLTIDVKITGEFGFEHNGTGGVIVLGNTGNDFEGCSLITAGGGISVATLINTGVPQPLGMADIYKFRTAPSFLRYTGGTTTTDIIISQEANAGADATVEHAGTGTLTFTGPLRSGANNEHALIIDIVDAAAAVDIAGTFSNGGTAPLWLYRRGAGKLVVSSACTHTGRTVVEPGGPLDVMPGGSLGAASLVQMAGGILRFNTSDTIGAVQVASGSSTLGFIPGTSSATLHIGSLANVSGSINFMGSDLGGTLKIFIDDQPDGLIGPWATVNNGFAFAAYDSVLGVHAANFDYQDLSARGPSPITNNVNTIARINSAGTSGGVWLVDDPTGLMALQHEYPASATVVFGNRTLATPIVRILPGGGALVLGDIYGDGFLLPDLAVGNRLYLSNANAPGGSRLTVNAAIGDSGADPVRLDKTGPGGVVLAGPVTHTGGTAIGEGDLTVFVGNSQGLEWPEGGISGGGGLIKNGFGTLFMPNVANTYSGITTIQEGIIDIIHNDTFGAKTPASPVIVEGAGAINFIGNGADQDLQLNGQEIHARGAGPDGLGALRNTGPNSQFNAIRFLTLLDDLTVYTPKRLDVRNSGGQAYLNLNGHGITKKGSDMFGFTAVIVTNDQDSAFIDITEGGFTLEVGTTLSGGLNNNVEVRDGAFFDYYNVNNPINWWLTVFDGGRVNTRAGYGMGTINTWAGPVTLKGRATFSTEGTTSDTYTGVISGNGPLVKAGGGDRGVTYLLGTNNTWTGGADIQNGVLYALDPGSLPGWDTDVTVSGRGTLALRVGYGQTLVTQPGFDLGQIDALLNNVPPVFTSPTASIGLDTAYEDVEISDPFPQIGIRKFGPNTLTLSGRADAHGPITVYGGTLDIPVMPRYLNEENITVGISSLLADPLAQLNLSGDAALTTFDRGYQQGGQPVVSIGESGRGVLRIADDAMISGRLIVGNLNGSVGAVYQTGGTMLNTGGHSNDGAIGLNGYGYYQLDGGAFTNKGYFQLGNNVNGYGFLRQTGGAFAFTSEYGGPFGISRAGQGVVYTSGGTFFHAGTFPLGENGGNNNGNGGYAELTVAGSAEVTVTGPIDLGARGGDMKAFLNLNGGDVFANRIYRADRESQAYVNWNGGTFHAVNADPPLFGTTPHNGVYPEVTLYERGAVIDIPDMGKSKAVGTPLRAPEGFGITAIPVADGGAGYLGSPFVRIEGGGGRGATAFAHVDIASGVLTHIEVTSPGQGYTTPPTVTLINGGYFTAATLGPVAIGPVASGGLLKLGEGRLTLNADNTYMGVTEVREGILRLRDPQVLSPYTEVTVTGGILDLSGGTLSNGNVTVTSGSIVNGGIAAGALTKTGPGVFTLTAPVTLGPASRPPRPLTPGLWEGMIREGWDQVTTPPKDGIQRTTRAANGGVQDSNTIYAGGLWNGNYHTWCYTGYLWNNSDEDVTWTFFGRMDDNMNLVIDGKQLIRAGNGSDAWAIHTLTPGPHLFEARFGDGTGDVGPGPKDRAVLPANGPMSGLLVDYSGAEPTVLDGNLLDLTDFQILEDPGDGSLFSIDLPDGYPSPFEPVSGPGLSEYVIYQNWNDTDDGIYISRQLTTRAANGHIEGNGTFANGMWAGNNHTWIYKGILWNRGEQAVTWNWRLLFDDDIALWIDGTLIAEARTNKQDPTFAATLIEPGAHTFEVRFGDGTGSVGPHSGLGGLTYDPDNTGSEDPNVFILLEDDGTGALLTTDLDWTPSEEEEEPEDPGCPVVNVLEGTLLLQNNPIAGLWEGCAPGAANWTGDPTNDVFAIELTTTAANGFCGENEYINDKFWSTNTTYIYWGYIWNRTDASVTWTFAENFDDNVRLWIDRTPYTLDWDDKAEVLADNSWDTPTFGTITLTPGPHKFELRLGQGGGGAGGNIVPDPDTTGRDRWGWPTKDVSFLVDYQGRDEGVFSNYEILQDPGNGYLLSCTLNDAIDKEELLDTARVNLAPGAVLDLNISAHAIGEITGEGTVSNGTLFNTVLSPAGDAHTGALTLSGVTLGQGITYRLTIDGAASDCLISDGPLDMSGVTIVPATETEPTAKAYVIAQAAGGITALPTLDGFPSKYKAVKRGNEIWLTKEGGTLLLLR
ncbi:MAG: autotransporter-associated beta strand repeat-containing protein [Kiritimatiellaeota bacterium]|nr:autotransporter-associated beta strand repeat-containing protein [Kiritimatiellota bacterium]